jgi:hypothetical protein
MRAADLALDLQIGVLAHLDILGEELKPTSFNTMTRTLFLMGIIYNRRNSRLVAADSLRDTLNAATKVTLELLKYAQSFDWVSYNATIRQQRQVITKAMDFLPQICSLIEDDEVELLVKEVDTLIRSRLVATWQAYPAEKRSKLKKALRGQAEQDDTLIQLAWTALALHDDYNDKIPKTFEDLIAVKGRLLSSIKEIESVQLISFPKINAMFYVEN